MPDSSLQDWAQEDDGQRPWRAGSTGRLCPEGAHVDKPNHWSQSESLISESPGMLKSRLFYVRPGPDVSTDAEMPVISPLHKPVGLACGSTGGFTSVLGIGALNIRRIFQPLPFGRSTSAGAAGAPWGRLSGHHHGGHRSSWLTGHPAARWDPDKPGWHGLPQHHLAPRFPRPPAGAGWHRSPAPKALRTHQFIWAEEKG